MTFALIRSHLQERGTVNAVSAARVLSRDLDSARTDLARWCRCGYLTRVKPGVYRATGKLTRREQPRKSKPAPAQRVTIEDRVLSALREHGMMRATKVVVLAELESRDQAHRALNKLYRMGKLRRVLYGMYAVARESL